MFVQSGSCGPSLESVLEVYWRFGKRHTCLFKVLQLMTSCTPKTNHVVLANASRTQRQDCNMTQIWRNLQKYSELAGKMVSVRNNVHRWEKVEEAAHHQSILYHKEARHMFLKDSQTGNWGWTRSSPQKHPYPEPWRQQCPAIGVFFSKLFANLMQSTQGLRLAWILNLNLNKSLNT